MRKILWLAAAAALSIGGYAYWRVGQSVAMPAGIAAVNGRLEAIEIDLAAKYGGRVVEVAVREGETVKAGQVLVRLDAAELEAELRAAEADLRRAEQGRRYAEEQVAVALSELGYSQRAAARSQGLAEQNHASREKLDAT
ncbi:biotin/lipoyl-binding protein [Methylogaea oryzae]|uniref:biotin/lipoyl-binding protein n=1 Tax=Methylogaea oryzae TaxID=1295382 RepID=UPI0006D08E41|nr:biotin/lipoyl-binding protein [Methylogaea oryzae]